MRSKRESLDPETIHSFIHSPPRRIPYFIRGRSRRGRESARGSRPDSVDRRSARAEISSCNRNPNGSTDELRSPIVGYYGKLVEIWAADNYPIELDYPEVDGLKFDATDKESGRPWDVKGSMVNGVRPTFKFWEDQHRTLGRENGGYVLVWYRADGREITVVSSRSVRAGR